MIKEKLIYGIHALSEALDSGVELDKLYIKKGTLVPELSAIKKQAQELGIPVLTVPPERLNRFTRASHQGVVALVSPIQYVNLEWLIPQLYEQNQDAPFIVVLDGITDVRNFGAIARTCECAGVHAIVIPDRESVSVTADAVNASAGALLRVPVCRVSSLYAACRYLQHCGLQLVGASEKASQTYTQAPLRRPLALVMGAEDKGISASIAKILDQAVAIPMKGKIASLNVSVACGILLYQILQQEPSE